MTGLISNLVLNNDTISHKTVKRELSNLHPYVPGSLRGRIWPRYFELDLVAFVNHKKTPTR
jgi:hypothetical protein